MVDKHINIECLFFGGKSTRLINLTNQEQHTNSTYFYLESFILLTYIYILLTKYLQ